MLFESGLNKACFFAEPKTIFFIILRSGRQSKTKNKKKNNKKENKKTKKETKKMSDEIRPLLIKIDVIKKKYQALERPPNP